KSSIAALSVLTFVGLLISWLLVSAFSENNDLGWRAVLPAAMVLIAATAAVMAGWPPHPGVAESAIVGFLLCLPFTIQMIHYNAVGDAVADGKIFARTPEMWAAVRRYAAPDQRVGNNPLFLKDMTPWPVNISWALLANRSSCFP